MEHSSPTSQMNIVVIGHVDHGKSTVIGRLLADTGSLPTGKLEQVKALCARNARPFEYAFLLDALKDEQSQGITIDTARSFFKTRKRRYVIIDAPGHIEFLKNMITGASRADAAFIVVDAADGVQENSKRHGYIASMLGLQQVAVLINKMDLVDFDEKVFQSLRDEYAQFLARLNLLAASFIPVCARQGINITSRSAAMRWYRGITVLEQFDAFKSADEREALPFRFPLQDIYKFTEQGDDRRIFAGTIETGSIGVGDETTFLPSGKLSQIAGIEAFNTPERAMALAGEAVGFTLKTQVYIKPGELMVKTADAPPQVGSRFRANLFWMGRAPMIKEKMYKLKLGTSRSSLRLAQIINITDASELTTETNKQQVDRHDVAECILETSKPVAFDLVSDLKYTGRFVVVDNYEIAGAGIVLESVTDGSSTLKNHVAAREFTWESGTVIPLERALAYGHGSKFVVFVGEDTSRIETIAMALEQQLFKMNFKAYYLRLTDVMMGLDADIPRETGLADEHIRRLGELARILTDSGQIFITSLANADDYDLKNLELLNQPNEILVVNMGENTFTSYSVALNLPADIDVPSAVRQVTELLKRKKVISDYSI